MSETNSGSIVTDEHDATDQSAEFDAADAFLKDLKKSPVGEPEEDPSAPPEETSEETGETTQEPVGEPEDPEFDIKVGEETRKAKLSDLKRLYGQEASLTQKSQALAEAHTRAETAATNANLLLKAQTERAQAAYKPYADLDMLALSVQMKPEDFTQLRAEAKAALENWQYHHTALEGLQKETSERQAVAHRERVTATLADLTDPVKGINGWGPELYEDVMKHAASVGMTNARTVVDAPAIRLMHKAMLYDLGQAKVPEVKKVVAKATVTLRPGAPAEAAEGDTFKAALKGMKAKGGNLDSTTAAFLAMGR